MHIFSILIVCGILLAAQTCLSQASIIVKDSIVGNVTWTSDNTYLIKGFLYVVKGANLTIEPGTLIKGEKATKGTLIVERGGKLFAQGTDTRPIVFTSEFAAGQRQNGDWGGIILCGNATINLNNIINGGAYYGGDAQVEGGPRSNYGGNSQYDNSGILRYVRIEFAGMAHSLNNETNGLTLCGVGELTQIDHVQVSNSGDDGFEWLGGTVNAKYLISSESLDDDWDIGNGWSGKLQFAVSRRNPSIADPSGSNGIESDNNDISTFANPRSQALLSNLTVVGPQSDTSFAVNTQYKNGVHFRANSQVCIYNTIVMGWTGGLFLDGSGVTTSAKNDTLQIRNTIFAGLRNGRDFTTNTGNTFNTNLWYATSTFQNRAYIQPAQVMLGDPFNDVTPNWTPILSSPAASGANFSNPKLNNTFFTPTAYIGAFDPQQTRWDTGWSEYNPKITDYDPRLHTLVTDIIFPNTNIGSKTDSAVVILQNAGYGTLTVTSMKITGTQFTVQGVTLPVKLAGLERKSITIRYTPNDTTFHTGSIEFVTSNQKAIVTLTGKGKITQPKVTTDVVELDFSFVPVGQSFTRYVVITNTGNAPLGISNMRIGGVQAANFSIIEGGTSGELLPSEKRIVSIQFSPTALSGYQALLQFDHNAIGSLNTIHLKGKGVFVPDAEVISGDISTTITLTNDRRWLLRGFVYVTDGGVLNIEPGTLIMGEKTTKGTLIVERGGKINALGTETAPIIFTSQFDPGYRNSGDWGGIVICGNAPINENNTLNGGLFNGGEASLTESTRSLYGGAKENDSSGVLRFVRVEFPGAVSSPNSQSNGLTLCGVGRKTIVDHIQVSYSGDDGVEFFGGTVNAKYLVVQSPRDDCWDTDLGWSGLVQFGVSITDSAHVNVTGSNGFESDNNNSGTYAKPRTQPLFSNMTIIGPQSDTGAAVSPRSSYGCHIRNNSQQSLYNSIVMGWQTMVLTDGTTVTTSAANDTTQIRNGVFAGMHEGIDFIADSGNTFDTKNWVRKASHGNTLFTHADEVQLTNPFSVNNPDFSPLPSSPVLNGSDFTNSRLNNSFFDKVSFRGAFGTARWDRNWTNYNPKTTVYAANTSLNVPSIVFAKTEVGTLRDSLVHAIINNTGTLAQRVSSMSISGSSDFEVVEPIGSYMILAGESKDITLRFAPSSVGVMNAKLQLLFSSGDPFEIDLSGEGILRSSVHELQSEDGVYLMQNVPNPANDKTLIQFYLPQGSNAVLEVVDIKGARISLLVNGFLRAGSYSASFGTDTLPNGTYFYRLILGNQSITKSMIILK